MGQGTKYLILVILEGLLTSCYVTLLCYCLYTVYYTAVYVTIYGEYQEYNLIETFWGETKTALRHVSTRPELTVEENRALPSVVNEPQSLKTTSQLSGSGRGLFLLHPNGKRCKTLAWGFLGFFLH